MTSAAITTTAAGSRPSSPRPITVRPAPRREPPYDDEARHLHLVGPHDRTLPFDRPDRRPAVVTSSATVIVDRGDLPDPEQWARRMLTAVLEARAGRRSPQ